MIVLAEHDPTWATAFAHEAERVGPAFGALLIALHHVGSTAVPDLVAKPVIDMLAIVSDVHALDEHTAGFVALGYEVMGEFGLPGRRYYRRDDAAGIRTHHLHAYAPDSSGEIARYLNFRDYLRRHPAVAREVLAAFPAERRVRQHQEAHSRHVLLHSLARNVGRDRHALRA